MSNYDNTNKGVLFTNDRKETDKHPDLNGSININGVEHWLSGWWKQGSKGEFLSLSIGKPKEQQQARPAAKQAPTRSARPPQRSSGFDDDAAEPPY